MGLILHIGMQKTGTSALQYFLNENRDQLFQDGFWYPALSEFCKVQFSGVSYHNCIAANLISAPSAFQKVSDDELSVLRDMIERSDRSVILSAEDFSRTLKLEKISQFTSGIDVSIIVYLREQSEWLQSLYNQRNKILFSAASDRLFHEDVLTPKDVFKFIVQERYAPLLRYDNLLDSWSSLSENIRVRIFSKEHFIDGDLISDFIDAIGITDAGRYKIPPRVNDNIANEWITIIRETAASEGADVARALMRRLAGASSRGAIDLSGSTRLLPEQIVQKVRSDYREHNERVAQKYFNRKDLF